MKRSPKEDKIEKKLDTRLRWKKIGGGRHDNRDGQIVTKGGILRAHAHELSDVIKAGFKCLDKIDPESMDSATAFIIKKVSKNGYDVLNPITMEPINDTPVSRKAAEAFGIVEEGKE